MASDGFDLLGAASGVREPGRCRLAQAVSGALWKSGFVAPFAEPTAEPGDRERRSRFRNEKGHVASRNSGERLLQFRMNGNEKWAVGLFLPDRDQVAAHVLPTEPHRVGSALRGVEQERHREPRLTAYRMPRLESRYFSLC